MSRKDYQLPTPSEQVGSRVSIEVAHKNWIAAHWVVDLEEAKHHQERLEPITQESPLVMLPGGDKSEALRRAIEILDSVGVVTVGDFLNYFIGGELLRKPQVGEGTIRKVLEALRLQVD